MIHDRIVIQQIIHELKVTRPHSFHALYRYRNDIIDCLEDVLSRIDLTHAKSVKVNDSDLARSTN